MAPHSHALLNSAGCVIALTFAAPRSYAFYLVFQLYTHADMFDEVEGDHPDGASEEEEEPQLSLPAALILLTAITVSVSFSSE